MPVRIISSFRDYYDSASGWDEEATPVYLRESVVSPVVRSKYWYIGWTKSNPTRVPGDQGASLALRHVETLIGRGDLAYADRHEFEYLFVGFCGLIAPAWRWRGRVYWNRHKLATELRAVPRSRRAERGCEELRRTADFTGDPDRVSASWPPDHAQARQNLPAFRALDCPVFLLRTVDGSSSLTRNPCLADLDFQRILDPFSARQAIETYLGNELAKELHPPQPISDEDMRDMKGFDGASFKTPPGGPTRKRKKKREG